MSAPLQHYSLRWLERTLGVPRHVLKRAAAIADSSYRAFPLKGRTIDRPIGVLVMIQKRIKIVLLQRVQFPDAFHGGIKDRSPRSNAKKHLNTKCLVKIDLRKHFPSVSSAQVYQIWIRYFGFGPDIASLLTKLTTYKGHLPQGTATSGYLANLALVECEAEIGKVASSLGLTHTFFVDDIALSGDRGRESLGPVIGLVRGAGFRVGRKKTAVIGASKAQVLTGLCVNRRQGPSFPRARIANIRSAINELRIALEIGEPTEKLQQTIRGRIAHVKQTNAGAAIRLERLLNLRLATSKRIGT